MSIHHVIPVLDGWGEILVTREQSPVFFEWRTRITVMLPFDREVSAKELREIAAAFTQAADEAARIAERSEKEGQP